ncbi:hypothetical protein P9139_16245 [Curtobacterium flaccumfaciens]|nr:hypothetical protein P9139_16245 [Curtobacterium flaccumfaciens]
MTTTTSHSSPSQPHSHAAPRSARSPRQPAGPSVIRPQGLGRVLLSFGSHILVPLFLAVGMGLAYLGAFHAPTPHDLPVGIVGQGAATQVFAQTVTDQSDGALVTHVVPSTAEAERMVSHRDLAAVYARAAPARRSTSRPPHPRRPRAPRRGSSCRSRTGHTCRSPCRTSCPPETTTPRGRACSSSSWR